MLMNPDHVTIVVTDLDAAKEFLTLLGFEEQIASVIRGETFSTYMGVPDIDADHVTMVLKDCDPRFDIQLLHYRHPDPVADPNITNLTKTGFNHLCFAVDDIETEVARLKAAGVEFRGDILDYHNRKLVFLYGPGGVTFELAQWH
ncbi:MAG: glyoxalase [Alphaproteobacteria bacterium]|nr:glyoxalase [Alphaproteobacteria bacterium]